MPPATSGKAALRERKRTMTADGAVKETETVTVVNVETPPTSKARTRLRIILFLAFSAALSALLAQRFGYLPRPATQPPPQERIVPPRKQPVDYPIHLPSPDQAVTAADVPKRDAVAAAFLGAWHAYEKDAFGADEYHPISHSGSNITAGDGIGYMIIDAIDTLWLMGMTEEYERAREWIRTELSFEREGKVNVFEVTIRVLGGLLSAHALTHDPLYLHQATLLASALLPAFDTPTGLPTTSVDLLRAHGILDQDNHGLSGTAEATTLQLEFKYLAEATGEEVWWRLVERVMRVVKKALAMNIVPIFINSDTGEFYVSQVRLGSRGDSYYEYLLKQYLQTNRTEHVYKEMYDDAMREIDRYLIHRSPAHNLTYTAELHPGRQKAGGKDVEWRLVAKQDHLACFLGGSLLLGVTEGQPPVPPDVRRFTLDDKANWHNGVEIIKTCMDTHNTATGLSPEIAMFHPTGSTNPHAQTEDWYIKRAPDGGPILDGRYILRPETIESLFLAFRMTGDEQYRRWGWQIFQAIEAHCKLPSGAYASVRDVQEVPAVLEDKMETFMMSETLKYLWLLFSDSSVLPLNEWVFNTEAHPLPVFTPSFSTARF